MSAMTAATIALSLISHTNAGKTTLARTLLGRDVGEVRDAPHVTPRPRRLPADRDRPRATRSSLWDTPGFGDSARLAKRLAQQGNPIGWFLTQVWDRFRDRAFWLTQQAVRNVRDEADVVLYLVNASEAPDDAGYLAPELAVLAWIGKPVIVLLNQTGTAARPAAESAPTKRAGARALARIAQVREVLPLDAFARCWVQEFALFAAIARVLARRRAACVRAAREGVAGAALVAVRRRDGGARRSPSRAAACDRVALPNDPLLAQGRRARSASAPGRGGRPRRAPTRHGRARRKRPARMHRSPDRDPRP